MGAGMPALGCQWETGEPLVAHPQLPVGLEVQPMNNHTWFFPPLESIWFSIRPRTVINDSSSGPLLQDSFLASGPMWSRGGFRGVLGATETTVLKNHLAECYTYSVRRARGDDFWILAEFPTASTQRNWRSSFGKRRQPRVNLSLENCRRYR